MFLFLASVCLGQTANFTVNSSVCKKELLTISNTSTSSSSYQWDFSFGDLDSIVATTNTAFTLIGDFPDDIQIEYDSGNWYGYAVNQLDHKMSRLNFGAALSNTPTVTNLGDFGLFSYPTQSKFYKDNGVWYGFVTTIQGNLLVRLTFGGGLSRAPTQVDNLGSFSSLSSPFGLEIIDSGGDFTIAVSNSVSNKISLVHFGSSLSNNPTDSDVIEIGGSVGFGGLGRISIKKIGAEWYGLVNSVNDSKVYRLQMGSTVYDTTNSFDLIGSITNPEGVQLVEEGGRYYGFVASRSQGFYKIDFGTDITASTPQVKTLGKFGIGDEYRSLEIVRDTPGWRLYCLSRNNGILSRVDFDDRGSGTPLETRTSPVPSGVYYSKTGTFLLELTAKSPDGLRFSISKSVTVLNSQAPDIDFTTTNKCVSTSNAFTPTNTSGDITSYSWDFNEDDVEDRTTASPSYTFGSIGDKTVKLTVSNGSCSVSKTKNITIYNAPVAGFNTPSANLCSNTALTFTNTSTYDTGSGVTWSWDFNEDGVEDSNLENPSYMFTTSGTKNITLKVKLASTCESVLTKQLALASGPEVGFTWTNNCYGKAVNFSNSSATGLTYSWDFGDGSSSSVYNTTHQYAAAGTYAVKLTVNDGTCSSVLNKSLVVNDQPLVSFANGSAVENLPVTFTGSDLTGADDSISSWSWDFGGLSSANGQTSSYTFSTPGSFSVKLSFATSQGCTSELSKIVAISQADRPSVSFSVSSPICKNKDMNFTNTCVNATSYKWDFCFGDLDSLVASTSTAVVLTGDFPNDIQIEYDSGNWYGYTVNLLDNKMSRLNFGTALSNTPTITNLGDFGLFNYPTQSKFYKDNGVWYGFVTTIQGNLLVRLTFGGGLSRTPTQVDNLGSFSSLSSPNGLEILDSDGDFTIVVSNGGSNKLSLIHFGNSLANTPTDTDVIETGGSVGFSGLGRISIRKFGSSWYGLINSVNDSKVYRLQMGSVVYDTNNAFDLVGSVTNPEGVELVEEGERYYGFIASRSSGFYKVDFGTDITGSSEIKTLGKYGISDEFRSLELVRDTPGWRLYSLSRNGGVLSRVDINDRCSGTILASTTISVPTGIKFSASGSKTIELTAYSSNGNRSSLSKIITVQNSQAPDIDFTTTNKCVSTSNTFTTTNTSGDITSYSWDFNGDNVEDSNVANPSYTFGSVGDKTTKLTVSNSFGCSTVSTKATKIYPAPPAPLFQINPSVYCANSTLSLINLTSEAGYDGLLTYQWIVDGVTYSTLKDATANFTQAGDHSIGLKSLLPECESNLTTQTITIAPAPLPVFKADTVCLGSPTVFINSSQNAFSYSWDFGDGATSTLHAPTHIYSSEGDYSVKLTSHDEALQCPITLTKSVRVNALAPVPNFEIKANVFCDGSTVTFNNLTDDASFGNEVKYYWSVTDLGTSTSKSPTFKYIKTGTKTASLYTVYRNCKSDTVTKTFEIHTLPTMDFDASSTCLGDISSFTNASSGKIFSWDFGDGFQSTSKSPDHLYDEFGLYMVKLDVVDSNGCGNTITKEVLVADLPDIDFTYQIACEGESVVLQDLSVVQQADIVSWEWFIGSESVSTDQNPELTFNLSNQQVVTLVVSSSNGCQSTYTEAVSVLARPNVALDINVGCLGEPTTFSDQSTLTGTLKSRSWYIDGISVTDTEKDLAHSFLVPGSHTVTLTIEQSNFCSSSLIRDFTILPAPTVQLETAGGCEGKEITATDLTVESLQDPIFSRVWHLNNQSIGNGFTVLLPALKAGQYVLSLEVITEAGCEYTNQQAVVIDPLPVASFTISTNYGIPPFTISTTNESTSGTSYSWFVNDSLYSTEVSPKITFKKEGDPVVKLASQNEFGCISSTQQTIRSRLPVMDLSINELQLVENGATYSILTRVVNSSNIPVEQMDFAISFENAFELSESIVRHIEVDQEALIRLNTSLPITTKASIICVRVASAYQQTERTPVNNEFCLSLEKKVVIDPPFPNPSSDRTSVRMVLPADSPVKLVLLDLSGEVKFEEHYSTREAGLTLFEIDLLRIDPGTYFLIIDYDGGSYQTRIIKQ